MKKNNVYRSIKIASYTWSKMDTIQVTKKRKFNIKDYMGIIETISKVEYKGIASNYLIEYNELVNLGIQVVHHLNKINDIEKLNNSYITTAIKWAIRNEVRRRWRWYTSKCQKKERTILFNREDEDTSELVLREAIYRTILSIDETQEGENPSTLKDQHRNPEESVVFHEMANAIRESLNVLTQRERELIENRFFNEKKLKDLSHEFKISPSRISRIIQTGLNKMKEELINKKVL